MTKRKPFPVGEALAEPTDADHVALMARKLMPRLRQIKDFLDAGDKWGLRYSLETLLNLQDEIWTGLALTWAGQSEEGGDRMVERCLPWWIECRALEEQLLAKAKRHVAAHQARANGKQS